MWKFVFYSYKLLRTSPTNTPGCGGKPCLRLYAKQCLRKSGSCSVSHSVLTASTT